jgi:hypothetical protein
LAFSFALLSLRRLGSIRSPSLGAFGADFAATRRPKKDPDVANPSSAPIDLFSGPLLFVTLAVGIAGLAFLVSLQKTMNAISKPNRAYPGWLLIFGLVPYLGAVWVAISSILISRGIRKDFEQAGRQDHSKGGMPLAIGMIVAFLCTLVPLVNLVAVVAFPVLWILYWVKTYKLRRVLPTLAPAAPASPVV